MMKLLAWVIGLILGCMIGFCFTSCDKEEVVAPDYHYYGIYADTKADSIKRVTDSIRNAHELETREVWKVSK